MSAALLAGGYAAAVAWWLPILLARLTAVGISARLGLVAWVTAMASVLTCAMAAVRFLVDAAIAHWPWLAEAVCRSVTGQECAAAVYRGAVFELALSVAAVIAATTAATLAWRYGLVVRRARRQTRAHSEAARITGRGLSAADTAVVLDNPRPAAYCMPGRPGTIVLTTGAIAVLDAAQLAAVIAHERAHLAGRHHLLVTLTRALAASIPALPLFTTGRVQVARLTEMCADDAAARRTARQPLLAALLAMGTGQSVPTAALAASTAAVTDRVQRLIDPPDQARQARNGAALIAVTVLLAVATCLVTAFAGSLAGG
ncbi:MAG TPA: M56 family metallopeptidase [Streptosporangiaceae bacterium]|nr:M56 family metallopeptidase [Streptosporangiaceae bacterium]